MPIIGAGVILATFVIKDAMRENLRDLIASIDKAEDVFTVRAESAELMQRVNLLAPRDTRPEDKEKQAWARINSTWQYLSLIGWELDNVSTLVHRLPSPSASNQKLQGFQKTLDALRYTDGRVRTLFTPPGQEPSSNRQDELLKEAQKNLGDCVELLVDVREFGYEMLAQARNVRRAAEERFRWFTWTSYSLYGLGWIIALLGKILQSNGSADTEEA